MLESELWDSGAKNEQSLSIQFYVATVELKKQMFSKEPESIKHYHQWNFLKRQNDTHNYKQSKLL